MNQHDMVDSESDESGIGQSDLDENDQSRTMQNASSLKLTKMKL